MFLIIIFVVGVWYGFPRKSYNRNKVYNTNNNNNNNNNNNKNNINNNINHSKPLKMTNNNNKNSNKYSKIIATITATTSTTTTTKSTIIITTTTTRFSVCNSQAYAGYVVHSGYLSEEGTTITITIIIISAKTSKQI